MANSGITIPFVIVCFLLVAVQCVRPSRAGESQTTGGHGGKNTEAEAPAAAGAEGGGGGEDECSIDEHDSGLDSSVRIAGFRLDHLDLLLAVALFIMIVVLAKMVWHHNFMEPISSKLPESCMLIVVGAYIGGIIESFYLLDKCRDSPIAFTPSLFFLVLLPPIVLEAGYFLDNRRFFENIVSINFYAFVGTIWNAFAVGLLVYGFGQADILLPGRHLSLAAALLFGTISAAIDPVAVLAVFDEIHVERLLHILIFGESLLNDAVTVVLFNLLGAFSNRDIDPTLVNASERAIGVDDVFLGIGQFVVVVIASVIIGILIGLLASLTTRFTEHVHVLEPIVVFAMGYLSYLLADLFEFSGILSLITCAIVMKHYIESNVSRKSHTTIKYTMKVLSNLSEMIIFLFLGISLFDSSVHYWDTGLILLSIVLALVIRPIGVIVQTLLLNCFRVKKIGKKAVFVMSYSGLRGAVAFSLALTRIYEAPVLMESTDPALQEEFIVRKSMLTAITSLVLFTVFVQGTTIKPLVQRVLKVRTVSKHNVTMSECFHCTVLDHITSGVEDVVGHFGHNRIRESLQKFDVKIMRKIFERYPEAMDEQILHTFKRLQYQDSKVAAEKDLVFKFGEDTDGGHISVCKEEEGVSDGELADQVEVPELTEVLKKSHLRPHEFHDKNVLPRTESDHRFEPTSSFKIRVQREAKDRHRRTRRARERSRTISVSSPTTYGRLPKVKEREEAIEIEKEEEPKEEKMETIV